MTTKIKNFDGLPLAASCDPNDSYHGGGFGYYWRDGIYVSFRMNRAHCEDIIELYKKSIGLLNNIKRLTS